MSPDVNEYVPGMLLKYTARDGRINDMVSGDYLLVVGKIHQESNLVQVLRVRGNLTMWWAEGNLDGLCDVIDTSTEPATVHRFIQRYP